MEPTATREERLAELLEAVLASSWCCERAYRGQRCGHGGCASHAYFIEAARAVLDSGKPSQ